MHKLSGKLLKNGAHIAQKYRSISREHPI